MSYKSKFFASAAVALAATTAHADQVFNDDLIVQGSICAGVDCVNGEAFGFDTLRLKENNLRIKAQDTSTTASFPSNDWQLTFNGSANGGQNKFSIDDVDNNRTPFTIRAGARNNALYVNAGGLIGLGTSQPIVELHIVDGNSPTVRLEQDGSSGFGAQTWDMAGNEANFFIRDATNGSTLPFKILPSAPNNALIIAGGTGDIGMGIQSPSHPLHVVSAGTTISAVESSDEGAVQIRLISDSANRRIIARNGADTDAETQIIMRDNRIELVGATTASDTWATVNASGIQLPNGAAFSVNGTNLNVPDYVFAPDYQLMPLTEVSAFIAENSHLPEVPSAAEINAGSLNMTEMQLTLLRKMEEMTLYTIAQHEQNIAQQVLIEALQAEISALKAQ